MCISESRGLPHEGDKEPVSATGLLHPIRRGGFIARACCAALPLQLLALMLLGFAALVPLCEQDCVPPNNFLYSLSPLYRYTDGQPPVWPKTAFIILHLKSSSAEHSGCITVHGIRCGLLSPICLSICWTQSWALQKWLSRSKCRGCCRTLGGPGG